MRRRFLAFVLVLFCLTGYGLSALAKGVEADLSAVREKKRVALTFDDGPHPHDTDRILTLLSLYGIKATFFVIGENAERYPEPLLRAVAEGHEIGNHTFHHYHMSKMNAEELKNDVVSCRDTVEALTGVAPTLFRPPEGVCTDAVREICRELGMTIIIWSVDTKDWAHPKQQEILDNVRANSTDGSIILMHDFIGQKSPTPQALKKMIPMLRELGYEFVTVSQLLRGGKA